MTLGPDNRERWGTVPTPEGSRFGAGRSSLSGAIGSEAGSTGGPCCKVILVLLLIAGIAGGAYYCGFIPERGPDEPSAARDGAEVSTATPIPRSNSTEDWVTWPELQAEGFPEDAAGLPRILLNSEHPDWSDDATTRIGALQIDCQNVDGQVVLELYVSRALPIPPPPQPLDHDPPRSRVEYSIDGAWRSGRLWSPSNYSVEQEAVFALKSQRDDIIAGLKDGAQQLAFRVRWFGGPEAPVTYRFSTGGFSAAFEPVEERCG